VLAHAAPATDPLIVLSAGAARAPVYVAPLARVRGAGAEAAEASDLAFRQGWYRGVAPVQLNLPAGEYVVSVALPGRHSMREAMQRASELVWDGFNQHAVVLSPESDDWCYARCYVVKKLAGQPLAVLAVFAPPTSPEQCAVFSPAGGAAVKFAGTVEQALEQLSAAGLPGPFGDEVADAVLTGRKVLLTTGETRWAVSVASADTLSIRHARATGVWSGHRLSVLTPE
jgi:hypothetical protein